MNQQTRPFAIVTGASTGLNCFMCNDKTKTGGEMLEERCKRLC